MKAKRLVLLTAAAILGASSLAGCAQAGSHAAQVGDKVVSTSDVDFLTRMQCDALNSAAKNPSQSGQVQTTPTRQIRAQMVNALVQSVVNEQLAAPRGGVYDRATYRQVMDQFEPAVQSAPAPDRNRFRKLVGDFYKGQLEVYAIAQQELAAQGINQPTDAQLQQVIGVLQNAYRKSVTVKINPVYGPDANDVAGAVDPSLSIAVSSYAKQAASGQPSAAFVAGLPSNLRCG